ncbi:CAP domain-containing protein [Lactobacillus sp. PV037]|uniref:CAP domain-containing protein n=1 Tax=Lactobacillus sp. PV037 TaxID=2594496 RepID=UPI00223ECD18|nr:CAP domain-containing protein [Lactobacillus sp. PV037]QNQ84243.1 CAP domain-containing protein [Lactobacillus sp. PV037]
MQFKRAISITLISAAFLIPAVKPPTIQVNAATFTQAENNKIKSFQQSYANLPKQAYSKSNLYASAPNLTKPFSPGSLNSSYLSTQLDYINFYRSLFGLTSITSNPTDNENAQITASVMAAINADPFVNQHGLPSDKRPNFISKMYWSIAKNISASSNLNFNVANQSPGEVIRDLITDSYNLDGSDTGHRAWLLSTRLTTTGLGAAYGTNGYRYSVQQVAYATDSFNSPSAPSVTYPSAGVFPIELLKGENVAWSLYLSDQTISKTPKITITDLDTGSSSAATKVHNYSSQGYGNFATILTYFPGNIKLVNGHAYSVKINGIENYTFKLFKLGAVSSESPTSTPSSATNNVAPNYNISPIPKVDLNQNQSDTDTSDSSSTGNNGILPRNDTNSSTDMNFALPTFNINSSNDDQSSTSLNEEVITTDPNLILEADKLRDTLNNKRQLNPVVFGRSYQNGTKYYNLGTNQWYRNFYITSNPQIKAGVISIGTNNIDTTVYSSPYLMLQHPTFTHLTPGRSYPYGQSIIIGKTAWYYLGPNQWIKQPVSLTNNLI